MLLVVQTHSPTWCTRFQTFPQQISTESRGVHAVHETMFSLVLLQVEFSLLQNQLQVIDSTFNYYGACVPARSYLFHLDTFDNVFFFFFYHIYTRCLIISYKYRFHVNLLNFN